MWLAGGGLVVGAVARVVPSAVALVVAAVAVLAGVVRRVVRPVSRARLVPVTHTQIDSCPGAAGVAPLAPAVWSPPARFGTLDLAGQLGGVGHGGGLDGAARQPDRQHPGVEG